MGRKADRDKDMIPKYMQRITKTIYMWLKKCPRSYMLFPRDIQRDMELLGRDTESYYIRKLGNVLGLFGAGALLLGAFFLQNRINGRTQVDVIERPEAYEETTEIILQVGRQDDKYPLELTPQVLDKKKADQAFEALAAYLETYILGGNESLEQVTEHLILPGYVEGYPFDIYWESDNEQLLDTVGTVNRGGLEEDCVVILTAVCYYGDWIWERQFGVLVQKEVLTDEERYKRALEAFLKKSESEERQDETWELPTSFEGEALQYKLIQNDYSLLWAACLVFVAGIAVWFGQDYDLRADKDKRQAVFQTEYVSFVSSLSLYISAGLNLQAAMGCCVADYKKRKEPGHLLREALQQFEKNIQNGYSFTGAMEYFADCTDHVDYRKLAGILNQGMLNGAQGLAVQLEKEVDKVREEKRRQCKVAGEQISTALIAPMMLQLGIVIALIMIPAFTNMQF